MLGGIKRFIKSKLLTDSHPFLMLLYHKRQLRILSSALAEYDAHSRMSYAEIESAVGSQYREIFGRTLNWDSPQTYNEKIHVSKVYMPDPIKTRLADKYLVREWITERIGNEYLIPLLGVYDSFDEIDFDALPDSFVIKCNHDSGSVTLVNDKSKINRALLKRKFDFYMKRNYAWPAWEMLYRDIPPKIIIEQYLSGTMNEYKFYCFDGKPYYCFTTFGRRGIDLSISFYDMDWRLQTFTRPDHTAHTELAPRPAKYDELKAVASKLCEGFGHVRVDLYLVNDKIYNGEMTFSTCGGFGRLNPDEWDYKFGELWPFDSTARAKVLAKFTRPADYHP